MIPLYTQPHELTWGDLVIESEVPTDVPWRIDMLADSASLGNPVPLVEVVDSILTDGSLSVVTSYGNREVTIRVRVAAPDGIALAQAEAAFMAEVMAERPAPLVWIPPSGGAWPCVFDVVTVKYEGDYSGGWDHSEKYRACLYYTLTFECLPWTRPLETSTIPAIPAPEDPDVDPTFNAINTADSTTGWTGRRNPTTGGAWSSLALTATGGKVRYSGILNWNNAGNYPRLGLRYAFPGGLTPDPAQPYLYFEHKITPGSAGAAPWVRWNYVNDSNTGVLAAAVAREALDNGNFRSYFEVPTDFSVTAVLFDHQPVRPGTNSATWTHGIEAYEIGLVDRIAIDGTNGFQVARTADVGGTAPTQAAIRFDAGADPLVGSTALIYTGASPVVPLRALRTESAGVDPDDTMISGATNSLGVEMVFRVPVSRLSVANYSLLARLNKTGSFTVSWSARIVDSAGADMPGSDVVESGAMLCTNSTTDPWMIHHLAEIPMPIIALEGSVDHAVEITLSMATGGGGVLIDEAWLADTENGAVTVIHEPSDKLLTAIELRSPQLDAPRPAVMGTWDGYGTQDISRLATLFGTHLVKPGRLHVFTATDLAKYAPCSLTYYERFHTRPGPPLNNPIDSSDAAA